MDQMNLAAAGPALGSNASYIEKLYARWKESPGAVAEAWQTYFRRGPGFRRHRPGRSRSPPKLHSGE